MKTKIALAAIAVSLAAMAASYQKGQQVRIKAIWHDLRSVSTGSHTNCTTGTPTPGVGTTTNCNSRNTGVVILRDTVRAGDTRYVIGCTARFIWQSCPPLIDGDEFDAWIDKGNMTIDAHANGNQGKPVHHKYRILDIRQLTPEQWKQEGPEALRIKVVQ